MKKPTVKAIGEDGNIFSIMAKVKEALVKADQREQWEELLDKIENSHSYNQALACCMEYVDFT